MMASMNVWARSRTALSMAALLALAACGGGGSSSSAGSSGSAGTVELRSKVVDGPIAGARVCLFKDGIQALTVSNAAICSADTDAEGGYTLAIPRDLAPGFLTLVVTKGDQIKLASALGTLAQVLGAAGSANIVTDEGLPAIRVTHFTTAEFALADGNGDGTLTADEHRAYDYNFNDVRDVAAIIKAVVDFDQAGALLGDGVGNTLQLAGAAAQGDFDAAAWLAAHPDVLAATQQDVADSLAGQYVDYSLTHTFTVKNIPEPDESGMYCGIGRDDGLDPETGPVQIALDATRGIIVMRFASDDEDDEDGLIELVGTFNPETRAVRFSEVWPTEPTDVPGFYSEGDMNHVGTRDATTGDITGTFDESSTTTRDGSPNRQTCTGSGTFTASKL